MTLVSNETLLCGVKLKKKRNGERKGGKERKKREEMLKLNYFLVTFPETLFSLCSNRLGILLSILDLIWFSVS
jgi:hypothetical protein